MAWRLEEFVLEGYFDNRRPNCTFGRLALRGFEMPIAFELTGDAGESLRGRSFEFIPRGASEEGEPAPEELAWQQIGPTGTMELTMGKMLHGDPRELMRGKILRFDWKPRLYLEWYSQNGRVVIELDDPELRLIEGEPFPDLEIPDEASAAEGPSITMMRQTDDDRMEIRTVDFADEEAAKEEGEGLDAYFERLNEETEARLRGEDPEFLRQMEIMERSIEGEDVEILGSLLESRQLPPPSDVDEERAEALVKSLLMELARLCVAVHLCEHCTMSQAYRYLVEEILHEGEVHPELKTTQWVQHYSYSESCPACEAKFEAEWEQRGDPAEE